MNNSKTASKNSHALLLYCEKCKETTKHYVKKKTCIKCTQNKNYDYKDCNIHGKVKHIGNNCITCKNKNLVSIKKCEIHGKSKFQGKRCAKCVSAETKTWEKLYCENCKNETTHQNKTCMKCNLGGFATGVYTEEKECLWKDLKGCKTLFIPNSGSQMICDNTHYSNCGLCNCDVKFTRKEGLRKLNTIKLEEIPNVVYCEACYDIITHENLSRSSKNIDWGEGLCIFKELNIPLTETSSCEGVFQKSNFHQLQCKGTHFLICKCGNDIPIKEGLLIDSLDKFANNDLWCDDCLFIQKCYSDFCKNCNKETLYYKATETCTICSPKNRTVSHLDFCNNCNSRTNHSNVENKCLKCHRNSLKQVKFCKGCQKDTTHQAESCMRCAFIKSLSQEYCPTCKKETTHRAKMCIACTVKLGFTKYFCEVCKEDTTHHKDICLLCRNRNYFSTKDCEIHGSSTFMGNSCMSCNSVKAKKTKVKNGTNRRSLIEIKFTAFLNLFPGFEFGKEYDGIDKENKYIFEYDGWFWHKDKNSFERDLKFTKKALKKGYKVVRIREYESAKKSLPLLQIENNNLLQLKFQYSPREVKEETEQFNKIIQQIKEFYYEN